MNNLGNYFLTFRFPHLILETNYTKLVSSGQTMNTREQIIHNSSELFLKYGFYKTTMDDIARELKISKKTIYKHFSTKNDLLSEIIENMKSYVRKNINRIVSSKDQSVIKIISLSDFLVSFLLKISEIWINDLRVHNPRTWENIEYFRKETILYAFNKIINQGKRENLIIDKPNIIIVTIILSAIQGIINPDFLLNNNFSVKEAFIQTFDILISGILTKKGRKVYKQYKKQGSKK